MAQIITSVDIEDAARQDIETVAKLGGWDITASAPPLPEDFDQSLPFVYVEKTGGSRLSLVVDNHEITCDVYGKTWAEANETARRLVGIVAALPNLGGDLHANYYAASVIVPEYDFPDTDHPTVPRVRVVMSLTTRADIKDI